MKVLVISHMYPSSRNPVLGIFVHKQVQSLIEGDCEVKVICPVPYVPFILSKLSSKFKAYYQIPEYTLIDGVEVYYPRYLELPKGILFHKSGQFMYSGIKRTVDCIYKNFKFDIIHSHVILPDGYASIKLRNKYNVPYVSTVHGQDFQKTLFKNKRCKKSLIFAMEKLDKIIAVSSKLKNMIKDKKLSNKICVINNGIDLHQIDDDHEVKALKGSGKKILSVSNLIKTKGIDINIMAVASIVKTFPDVMYYIIGDGKEKNELQSLVKKNKLENNVVFLGRIKQDEVIKYMKACDIFSLPSWEEGFGIVYIEAMSCGKPVIGVLGEGIQDVIHDKVNGFLVRPKDISDVVETLTYLIRNPEVSGKVGMRAKETVSNNLTWSENAKKTIEIYNSFLDREEDKLS